ncbi:MAG: hypothetical protein ACQERC_03540 [Bacteroidota bacterium]
MWGKLSLLAFFGSLISLVYLSTGFPPIPLPTFAVFYFGVVTLGILGFVFSLLSNFFDRNKRKTNRLQSLIFYLGMMLVFAGLMFKFLHWPFSIHLIGLGILVSLVSFFFKGNMTPNAEDELLDDDV